MEPLLNQLRIKHLPLSKLDQLKASTHGMIHLVKRSFNLSGIKSSGIDLLAFTSRDLLVRSEDLDDYGFIPMKTLYCFPLSPGFADVIKGQFVGKVL